MEWNEEAISRLREIEFWENEEEGHSLQKFEMTALQHPVEPGF